MCIYFVCIFKQKTAYEVRISDWSSDVCSSDLAPGPRPAYLRSGYGAVHRTGGRSDGGGRFHGQAAVPRSRALHASGHLRPGHPPDFILLAAGRGTLAGFRATQRRSSPAEVGEAETDRKSVVLGKRWSVRGHERGWRIIKKK